MYKVGDEVVLATTNLCNYCPHLPPKIKACWIGPFPHHPKDIAQLRMEWICHHVGGSIPSSMLAS